ncbi:FAD-dependent oxidoreductase [Salipaludibacillus keqinensis]|uniref:FAD-dependent oxidoreductase n=1 Tax=Salipaludibacillus keqinensis TaxID=2045207 RepID=A0A323TGH4_9BACI|nr:FAD-dependent oxidoreductase [Salipaludibacillus keqinensis]PYZ91653.1 FAD-dependent oxidoreductase [Salipaludibacillus keqinensis]
MNLQSGTYYWPTTMPDAPSYPTLAEDINCDVLVIGAGTSGAQCAYYLADKNLDVIVVEKGTVGHGSTATNTALIQYSGEKMFIDLVNAFGEEYVGRHLQLCRQAIDQIEDAQTICPLSFEFTRRNSLNFASYAEDVERLKQEAELLKKHQFPLDFWSEKEISQRFPFSKRAANYSYGDGELNPFKFTHSLLQYATHHGTDVFENTEVNGMDFHHDHVEVRTKTGHMIHAKQVIVSAGYEGTDMKKEKNTVFVSTYTVTTKPVQDFSGWHERALIWETARPYVFIRTTADNRVIIGGLDDTTSYPEVRDSMLINKRDRLIEEFNKLFPAIHVEPDYYSAAFYGGTHDGLPIIGQYPDYPNCHFLFGFGDNGTVYSMILAKIIADKLTSQSQSDMPLYDPSRPLKKQMELS